MNAFCNRKFKINQLIFIASTMIFCIIACVLLFWKNIIPAAALEQELRCGMEAHIHTDSCYDGDFLICEKPAHSHDGNCYIVLLKENNINHLLTLLGEEENDSLETVITDVMSTALTLNSNINTLEETSEDKSQEPAGLSQTAVSELNTTISDEDSIPDLVLNENINNIHTLNTESGSVSNQTENSSTTDLAEDNSTTDYVNIADNITENNSLTEEEDSGNGEEPALLAVDSEPVTSNYNANFYIYLDGQWTCIGSLPFETTRNGTWYYNSTIPTSQVLELINNSLKTEFTYNSFDISVSSSLNGTYSKNNIGIGSVTTTIGYRQNNSTARRVKYVRLIPNNGSASSTAFAFYSVKYMYPDGSTATDYVRSGTTVTLPDGNYQWTKDDETYAAGETVTITDTTIFYGTTLGPITYISINYDVNFPTVNGVTVSTKPTISGLSTTTVTDGYTEGSSAVVRNVSRQSVEGKINGHGANMSRIVQFKGWKIAETDMIIQPNTVLVWEELIQYANGASLSLIGEWESDKRNTVSFCIRFDSVAVDTEGNITDQDSNNYTDELFAAYVGGIDPSLNADQLQTNYGIADKTQDNSYTADQEIRALYGEKTDGVWLSAFPLDDYIFECLVQYAETGHLLVEGVVVKAEDLNDKEYAIRWYVFKYEESDAWHIDGKLVKKEGLIHVYKTFAGNKELIAAAKEDFYIDAYDVTSGTNTTLDLNNYFSYDSATDTYMWEITNVDYGELWEITEHPHLFEDPDIDFHVYSEYTVMDAHGDQSVSGAGTSRTVSGMTYALDEGVDEVLRVEFTNIYNKNDSIVIKKQDSLTGVSIGGATFQLLQNGEALKFNYNGITDSYEYDPVNGTETILSGRANGYFEIAIENFSYDSGPIIVREVTPPDGYSPIGDIEIGYTDDSKTIGILSGNSQLIKYINGILIVGNSTDTASVTAKKSWDCPEAEWQDVTVELLANGKLVTTVIAGVEPYIILNGENQWTYTWENLPLYVNGTKIEWSIQEIQIGSEKCKSDGTFVNWLASYGLPVYSTDADGKDNILLTVTNTTKRVMLRLTKTDMSKSLQLKGATFLLEGVDENGNVISSEIAKTATTSDAGTLIFDNLKCNVRYRLTEQTAPDGYLKINEYLYITILEDGSILVEDSYYAEPGSTAYNMIVRNGEAISLPESGGTGNGMLFATGMMLILAAGGIYINGIFRKRGCQNI